MAPTPLVTIIFVVTAMWLSTAAQRSGRLWSLRNGSSISKEAKIFLPGSQCAVGWGLRKTGGAHAEKARSLCRHSYRAWKHTCTTIIGRGGIMLELLFGCQQSYVLINVIICSKTWCLPFFDGLHHFKDLAAKGKGSWCIALRDSRRDF